MTAEEIRAALVVSPGTENRPPVIGTPTIESEMLVQAARFLQEIAAQLAELHELFAARFDEQGERREAR